VTRHLSDDEVGQIARSVARYEPEPEPPILRVQKAQAHADAETGEVEEEEYKGPRLVRLSDVKAEPIDWLWLNFLARKKLAFCDGDPGIGKTFAMLAVAAAITSGRGMPGLPSGDPRTVILLTAEDDLEDTIRPRIEMLGGDPERLFSFDDLFQLDEFGIALLNTAMEEVQPALLIIDPIMAFIPGNVDIYKPNQVRRITNPLRQLAKRYNCAIVGIRHLTKGQKDRALYRGAGGMDFAGAARTVLLVGADPDNPDRRAIVQTKTNLGPKGASVGYSLDDGVFRWTGDTDLTADHLAEG
jgi:RecA-family ATPase